MDGEEKHFFLLYLSSHMRQQGSLHMPAATKRFPLFAALLPLQMLEHDPTWLSNAPLQGRWAQHPRDCSAPAPQQRKQNSRKKQTLRMLAFLGCLPAWIFWRSFSGVSLFQPARDNRDKNKKKPIARGISWA